MSMMTKVTINRNIELAMLDLGVEQNKSWNWQVIEYGGDDADGYHHGEDGEDECAEGNQHAVYLSIDIDGCFSVGK